MAHSFLGSQLPCRELLYEKTTQQGNNLSTQQPVRTWSWPETITMSLETDPPLVKHSDEITAPGCTLTVTCWRLLLKATELEVNLLGKQITKGKQSKRKQITNQVAQKIFTSNVFLSNVSCSPQKIQFIVFSLPKSRSSDIVTMILQRKLSLPMGQAEPISTVC